MSEKLTNCSYNPNDLQIGCEFSLFCFLRLQYIIWSPYPHTPSIDIRNLSDPEASIATMLTRRLLRQLTTLARLLLPRANHTRQAKEISPEEVQRFREKLKAEQAQRGTSGASNQQYYQTKPLSDYQYYEGDPSQHRTVFESPPNPNGIITPEDPVYDILKEPTLVIERQIEMMNISHQK